MSGVTVLCQDEQLWLDPDRLAEIYIELGDQQAQLAVERATDDLVSALNRIAGLRRIGKIESLARAADRVFMIADPLGLSSLSMAAGNVRDAARSGDRVALSATMARLERVAERSLSMVLHLNELAE